jgi:hypothetical protein
MPGRDGWVIVLKTLINGWICMSNRGGMARKRAQISRARRALSGRLLKARGRWSKPSPLYEQLTAANGFSMEAARQWLMARQAAALREELGGVASSALVVGPIPRL